MTRPGDGTATAAVRVVASACAMLALGGCATVATVQTVDHRSARVYSGTRLDLLAASGASIPSSQFRTAPPPYPLLDLPVSFVLDTVMLPLTLGISGTFGH